MRKRASIEFRKIKEVAKPILKFGGEPFGLPKELWPRSKETGEAMQFICQIPFGPELFPGTNESMAYLFLTVEDAESATWEPDGGENRVVILPKNNLTSSLTVGDAPRLYRMTKKFWSKLLRSETCIFEGKLSFGEDPDFVPCDLRSSNEEERDLYLERIGGNKLGGAPLFIQSDELPFPEEWHLLLQLDSVTVPFRINFGDAGIGYAFLNKDGSEGKFLWQCC